MKTERDFKRLEAEIRRLRQCLRKARGTLHRLAQEGQALNIRARESSQDIDATLNDRKTEEEGHADS